MKIEPHIYTVEEMMGSYIDIDGDGVIDAEEMQHKIGLYEHISDPDERFAARLQEGHYILALELINTNRESMHQFDQRYGTMTMSRFWMT